MGSESGGQVLYRDRFIECTSTGLRVRGYYFPWGTKQIPYSQIRAVTSFQLSALRGKARLWGTSTFRTWANFDPSRPSKSTGLVLDIGRRVKVFLTPDDAGTVAEIISEHAGIAVHESATGPFA